MTKLHRCKLLLMNVSHIRKGPSGLHSSESCVKCVSPDSTVVTPFLTAQPAGPLTAVLHSNGYMIAFLTQQRSSCLYRLAFLD